MEKLNQLIQDKVDGKVKYVTDTTSLRIGKRFVIKIENDTSRDGAADLYIVIGGTKCCRCRCCLKRKERARSPPKK